MLVNNEDAELFQKLKSLGDGIDWLVQGFLEANRGSPDFVRHEDRIVRVANELMGIDTANWLESPEAEPKTDLSRLTDPQLADLKARSIASPPPAETPSDGPD